MKFSSIVLMAILVLSLSSPCNAQAKNFITETVRIYGSCGMCESTIEKAGSLKNVSQVDWDKDTQMATLSFDPAKTNQAEILKRIALSGYDSDLFLAPTSAYAKLPKCCQYERVQQSEVAITSEANSVAAVDRTTTAEDTHLVLPLKAVFDSYFTLKDALVQTNANTATAAAKSLLANINAVKMEQLSKEEHTVWMQVKEGLAAKATRISATTDIEKQREDFIMLSKAMYDLVKVSRTETPTYYQYCPMANDGEGANWLSKESAVKNPYYGSMMLSCGKTIETIN